MDGFIKGMRQMRIRVDRDEIFPVYSLVKSDYVGLEIEIADDLYQEFMELEQKYQAMQKKLGEIYERADEQRELQRKNRCVCSTPNQLWPAGDACPKDVYGTLFPYYRSGLP